MTPPFRHCEAQSAEAISRANTGFYQVTLPLYPPPFDKGGGIIYIREAKPLFNSPVLDFGLPLVPLRCLLVGVGDFEYGFFTEGLADNLQTYGQPIGKASRDGNSR